ncbi:hypothetical protein NBRC116493_16660 [Aurantivibrio infirmus]
MIEFIKSEKPELSFEQELKKFLSSGSRAHCFALKYNFIQTYLPGNPAVALLAVVFVEKSQQSSGAVLQVFISDDLSLEAEIATSNFDLNSMRQYCADKGLACLNLNRPLRLDVVKISKPWGQEIWYTGIEERGQSSVVDEFGNSLPLPWLFSLASETLLARHKNLILLKILDPLPEPVFGDLYFELHEEKREVYVVTNVDAQAWPNGKGGIRFGFDQVKRRSYANDEAFKAGYVSSVNEYRVVREAIDAQIDGIKQKNNIALDAPLNCDTLKSWLAEISAELREDEKVLREEMESFIHVAPLSVGDVVKVPHLTPHSLLHGVRTIEFQTPVYERKILSFAQKVLTQQHWDTEEAIKNVELDTKALASLTTKLESDSATIEEIVSFDDFIVDRITLKDDAVFNYVCDSSNYHLVVGVSGLCSIDGAELGAENAVLIAAGSSEIQLRKLENNSKQALAIILIARPR